MEEILPPGNEVNKKIEYTKFAGIVLAICVLSGLHFSQLSEPVLQDLLRLFMGYFMVVFALFKLVGYKMFAMMFPSYDIVAARFKAYAYAFPFIELLLGLLALANIGGDLRLIGVLIIMGLASIGVANEVYRKKNGSIGCACLGSVIRLPLSTISFVENFGMVGLALTMLAL